MWHTDQCTTPTSSTTPPITDDPRAPFPVALTAGVAVTGGLVLSAVIVTVVIMASVLIGLKKGSKTSNRQDIVTSLAINTSYGRTQGQELHRTRPRDTEESLYSYPTERAYHIVPIIGLRTIRTQAMLHCHTEHKN